MKLVSMSLQLCPQCHQKSITWSIDEERSPLTQWWCNQCHYLAMEDENKMSLCTHCGRDKASLFLTDSTGHHRWCPQCQHFEQINSENDFAKD